MLSAHTIFLWKFSQHSIFVENILRYIYIYTHNLASGEGQHGVVIKSTDSEASPPWLDSGSVASSSVILGTPFNPVTQFPPPQNNGGDSRPCLIQL